MNGVKQFSGLAILTVIVCALATPAYAEFKSQSAATKGTAEELNGTVEAGGATVHCVSSATSPSEGTWTVKNKTGEAAEVGPNLALNITSWGECKAKTSTLKEQVVSVGGCEINSAQTEGQTTALASVLTTCTLKVLLCEVKIEPAENKGLKDIVMGDSGESSENLVAEMAVSNLTTKVNGGCEAIGIAGSKTGTLKGDVEMLKVDEAGGTPIFMLTATPRRYTERGQTGTITVTNTSGVQRSLTLWEKREEPSESFKPNAGEMTCREKVYAASGENAKCKFSTEVNNAAAIGVYSQTFYAGGGSGPYGAAYLTAKIVK